VRLIRCRYRLETTAKLIAVGLLEPAAPDAAQDLTTAKTVAKISVVSNTAGGKKSVARRSTGLDYSSLTDGQLVTVDRSAGRVIAAVGSKHDSHAG
jgi:hypothetical protein